LYNRDIQSAAHKKLPFGTMVKVTILSSDKYVIVRINDRGPHTKKRVIDLSYSAAKSLGSVELGIARVKIEVIND